MTFCHLRSSLKGDLASKPEKSKLMIEIEKVLVSDDMVFPQGDAVVIVDFMSKIRSFSDLSSFGTFGNAVRCLLNTGQSMCSQDKISCCV